MEKYNLSHDIKVIGVPVTTFPNGIGEAFDGLMKMLPDGDKRLYYGISECTKEGIVYKAAALERYDGEGEKYSYETYIIEKGEYLTETVKNWLQKTDCIKTFFEEMFKDEKSDRTKPCIEMYKNEEEMLCMVKVDKLK